MQAADHPDPVARLRLALWGSGDPASAEAQRHAATCPECGLEIGDLRRIRDAVRLAYGVEPSAAAAEAAERAVREAASGPPAPDFDWLLAMPVPMAAGVRGGAAEPVLRCDDGDLRVEALLAPSRVPGHVSVSGQVLFDGREPGAGLDVTLFLDRRPAGVVRTDDFGEFTADVRRAGRIGVRVAGRGRARHVEFRAPEARS